MELDKLYFCIQYLYAPSFLINSQKIIEQKAEGLGW